MKNNWNIKMAFTLSEVLVTLAIIGVIAAITIPTLLQNMNEAQLKTRWKKAYSVASQAWKSVVAENPNTYTGRGGWSCTWPTGETKDYEVGNDGRTSAFKDKMSIIKSCINQTGCWASSFENFTGGQFNTYSWVTSDGMCWANPFFSDPTHIAVDTNCEKGPNKWGQDMFWLMLGVDGNIYFAIGDKSPTGKPVSSGNVCPYTETPYMVNGREVDFTEWLRD